MRLYTYKLYDCVKQEYQSALRVLDATRTFGFNTMWSLQGLRLRAESSGIYALIGGREVALPREADYTIAWSEIDGMVQLYHHLGKDVKHFLNIEVSEAVDEAAWVEFRERVMPYLDDEARVAIYTLGLAAREVELAAQLYDDAPLGEILAAVDSELCEVVRAMERRDSNSEVLARYRRRFEKLRYDVSLEVLRRNTG
ncbi:MAG: hypothetical protein J6Q33_02150, partial [Alistipes sp.]|nr:hypothetical protein [Alistipes sp.]